MSASSKGPPSRGSGPIDPGSIDTLDHVGAQSRGTLRLIREANEPKVPYLKNLAHGSGRHDPDSAPSHIQIGSGREPSDFDEEGWRKRP